jgi:hypothetical protein
MSFAQDNAALSEVPAGSWVVSLSPAAVVLCGPPLAASGTSLQRIMWAAYSRVYCAGTVGACDPEGGVFQQNVTCESDDLCMREWFGTRRFRVGLSAASNGSMCIHFKVAVEDHEIGCTFCS